MTASAQGNRARERSALSAYCRSNANHVISGGQRRGAIPFLKAQRANRPGEGGMYDIAITSPKAICIKLAGTMSVEEVSTYIADLRRQMVVNRVLPGYGLIIDVTECTIQTQDMINAMAGYMAQMPKAGAIAVVSARSLARMQIRRLFAQSYARVTSTAEDARAWVVEGIEPPADRTLA